MASDDFSGDGSCEESGESHASESPLLRIPFRQLTAFLGRNALLLMKLEDNTAAVATALRIIAAVFGHAVEIPG